MSLQIELMTEDHYDGVLSLWQATDGVGLNESDTREQIAAYLKRNPGQSLIARDGSTVVAAVLCGHDGRRGYLHHLAVAPEYRKQGLGARLVESCLETLAALGILKCNIFLYADNDAGSRFWANRGWSERQDLKVLQYALPDARLPAAIADTAGKGQREGC